MIGIIGDVMLDIYTYGRVTRFAPEAKAPVLEKNKDNFYLGGAGNTAKNLVSLNKKVFLFGLVGNDKEGVKIRKLCKENNINFFFVNDGRPTISKHRYLDYHKNKIHIRIDTEKKNKIKKEVADKIIKELKKKNLKILIISDYAKGLVTNYLISKIKKELKNTKLLVDPKPKNINLYKDAFLIKINEKEAIEISKILNINKKNINSIGKSLVNKLRSHIIVTLGHKGCILFEKNKNVTANRYYPFKLKSKVKCVAGAGDTFLAILAFCLDFDFDLNYATKLANRGANIIVRKRDTSSITREELFNYGPKKAIFFDRDGVINEDPPHYVHKIQDFRFIGDVFKTLKVLKKRGFLIFIITNQSGVARGYYGEKEVIILNNYLIKELKKRKIYLDGISYCPHHPNAAIKKYKLNCFCRKPKPGMILKLAEEKKINLSKSWVIGDKISDIIPGKILGCKTVLLLTGHGKKEVKKITSLNKPDYIFNKLSDTLNVIK